MSTIQNAIQLNNQAVSSLESSLFSSAMSLSSASLTLLQRHRHTANQVSLQQDHVSIDQLMLDQGSPSSSNSTMDEFVFEQGIVLPTTTVDIDVITAVLIFNCALCQQLLAKHGNNEEGTTHDDLERARQLYRLAYGQQDRGMNSIFKFAIANNIGVIHKNLGDFAESNHCFGQLVSLMMAYVSSGVDSGCLQHLQGFWNNVLENGSTAPAA